MSGKEKKRAEKTEKSIAAQPLAHICMYTIHLVCLVIGRVMYENTIYISHTYYRIKIYVYMYRAL